MIKKTVSFFLSFLLKVFWDQLIKECFLNLVGRKLVVFIIDYQNKKVKKQTNLYINYELNSNFLQLKCSGLLTSPFPTLKRHFQNTVYKISFKLKLSINQCTRIKWLCQYFQHLSNIFSLTLKVDTNRGVFRLYAIMDGDKTKKI